MIWQTPAGCRVEVGLNYGQQREDHYTADRSAAFNSVLLKSYSYSFVALARVLMFSFMVVFVTSPQQYLFI